MIIGIYRISFKALRERTYRCFDDRYGLAHFMTETVRKCMLACPNYSDDNLSVMHLGIADGIVVGRNLFFPTKFKADNKVYMAQTGGSLFVHKSFRNCGIGLMILSCNNEEHDVYIGALYSKKALSIYRKKGDVIIESPLFLKPRNMEFFLRAKGLNSFGLSLFLPVVNGVQWMTNIFAVYRKRMLRRRFSVERVQKVPEWVGELACNDGHKYMELHTTEWLQWCLDYNMSENLKDEQAFFVVKENKGDIRAFFMTKVRYGEELGPYRNINTGTIVEWGSTNESELSESDIFMLAEDYFANDISTIITVAQDDATKKRLPWLGYHRRGNFVMSFCSIKNHFVDISDRYMWRIRFGCCNTIILQTSR